MPKTGKGKGPDLKSAIEEAKKNSGGEAGWYRVTNILARVDNPLREYHVTVEETQAPPQ
jgi:hypothetical protein